MMQASLATCYEFATGVYIVGSGICSLLEMHAVTVQKWTTLVSIQSDLWHKRWIAISHIFSEMAGKQHALDVLTPSPSDP